MRLHLDGAQRLRLPLGSGLHGVLHLLEGAHLDLAHPNSGVGDRM